MKRERDCKKKASKWRESCTHEQTGREEEGRRRERKKAAESGGRESEEEEEEEEEEEDGVSTFFSTERTALALCTFVVKNEKKRMSPVYRCSQMTRLA